MLWKVLCIKVFLIQTETTIDHRHCPMKNTRPFDNKIFMFTGNDPKKIDICVFHRTVTIYLKTISRHDLLWFQLCSVKWCTPGVEMTTFTLNLECTRMNRTHWEDSLRKKTGLMFHFTVLEVTSKCPSNSSHLKWFTHHFARLYPVSPNTTCHTRT